MSDDIKTLFIFNSRQPFFDKERHGIKNNTVREIDLNDSRFTDLIYWLKAGWNMGDIRIQINNVNGSQFFQREIRDISVYNNLVCITWEHINDFESDSK